MTAAVNQKHQPPTTSVIPRGEAPWESPGRISQFVGFPKQTPVPIFGALVIVPAYQEIATTLRASQ